MFHELCNTRQIGRSKWGTVINLASIHLDLGGAIAGGGEGAKAVDVGAGGLAGQAPAGVDG